MEPLRNLNTLTLMVGVALADAASAALLVNDASRLARISIRLLKVVDGSLSILKARGLSREPKGPADDEVHTYQVMVEAAIGVWPGNGDLPLVLELCHHPIMTFMRVPVLSKAPHDPKRVNALQIKIPLEIQTMHINPHDLPDLYI